MIVNPTCLIHQYCRDPAIVATPFQSGSEDFVSFLIKNLWVCLADNFLPEMLSSEVVVGLSSRNGDLRIDTGLGCPHSSIKACCSFASMSSLSNRVKLGTSVLSKIFLTNIGVVFIGSSLQPTSNVIFRF